MSPRAKWETSRQIGQAKQGVSCERSFPRAAEGVSALLRVFGWMCSCLLLDR